MHRVYQILGTPAAPGKIKLDEGFNASLISFKKIQT